VVQALQQVKGVLVLTDTIDALKAGGSGAEDLVASYLGTYLGKGQLRILGEITPRALEAAKGIKRRMGSDQDNMLIKLENGLHTGLQFRLRRPFSGQKTCI
jgi:hypothetical protein